MGSAPTTDRLGLVAVGVGVFFFSTGPTIAAGTTTAGLTLAFWRVLLAGSFFAGLTGWQRQLSREMLTRTAMAGVAFGLANALFFEAVQATSVANATLIAVMQPVPLLIAGRLFFGERSRPTELAWVVVALGGAALMVVGGSSAGSADISGDLLAAGSMLLTAVYFIGAKRARAHLATVPFMAGMWFWATVSLAPLVVLAGEEVTPLDGGDWVRTIAIATLPGIGHFLINFAHQHTPLAVVAVFQLFNPACATVLALVFLDQQVTGWQWLGMATVIVGLAVFTVLRSPADQEPTVPSAATSGPSTAGS